MRDLIHLIESAGAPQYFFHVSSRANLASIRKQGLVANSAGSSADGNYDGALQSLPGTYMTDDLDLIAGMISRRDDLEDYIIAVIEVTDMSDLLPDEDIIDIVLNQKVSQILGDEEPNYEDDEVMEALYTNLGQGLADAVHTKLDKLMLSVARNWVYFHFGGEDGFDENLNDLKERFVKAHPQLRRYGDERPHSLRYPGNIGFQGDPRIVAIVAERNETLKTVVGKVPPGAQAIVNRFSASMGLDSRRTPKSSKPTAAKLQELLALAKQVWPNRSEFEMRNIASQMDATTVNDQIARLKQSLAK